MPIYFYIHIAFILAIACILWLGRPVSYKRWCRMPDEFFWRLQWSSPYHFKKLMRHLDNYSKRAESRQRIKKIKHLLKKRY